MLRPPSNTYAAMTVASEYSSLPGSHTLSALEDRFEVIKEIGDGSFGSVALARVRGSGASVARRGTMVWMNARENQDCLR